MSDEKFTCFNCGGKCCKFIELLITVKEEFKEDFIKWINLHNNLKIKDGKVIIFEKCSLLADGRCLDYENRPELCKNFKVGGELCQKARMMK